MVFQTQKRNDRQAEDRDALALTKLTIRTKETKHTIFRLLDLPLKIRTAILGHVVVHAHPVPVGRHTLRLPSARHTIMLANKQLCEEALFVYHTCNRFSVALMNYDIKPALPALQEWMGNYDPSLAISFDLRVDGAWRVFVDGQVDWKCVREWIKLAREGSIPLLLPTRGTSASEHESVGPLIDIVSGAQQASDEEAEELLCAYRRMLFPEMWGGDRRGEGMAVMEDVFARWGESKPRGYR